MAQQEAANQKMQAQQDTHNAADSCQQQAEVHVNLYDAASVVLHFLCWTLPVAGDACCIHPEHVTSVNALLYKLARDA